MKFCSLGHLIFGNAKDNRHIHDDIGIGSCLKRPIEAHHELMGTIPGMTDMRYAVGDKVFLEAQFDLLS
jgi:hypothetical protein